MSKSQKEDWIKGKCNQFQWSSFETFERTNERDKGQTTRMVKKQWTKKYLPFVVSFLVNYWTEIKLIYIQKNQTYFLSDFNIINSNFIQKIKLVVHSNPYR